MKTILQAWLTASEQEWEQLMAICQVRRYPKHAFLLQAGQPADQMFFLQTGLLRGYRLENGQEITHHFFKENWMGTDYESYLQGSPASLFIQAMTPCQILSFSRDDFEGLMRSFHVFERLGRVLAEQAYLVTVKRAKALQSQNLKARYLQLLEEQPKLFQLVPQKHIASYLGVAPQSLSRLRETLRNA